jgi:hypothetical protein
MGPLRVIFLVMACVCVCALFPQLTLKEVNFPLEATSQSHIGDI